MTEIGYQAGSLPGWAGLAAQSTEKNPDLVWPKSIEVYDRMRTEDPQVASILRAVTLPLQESEWRLDPTGCRDEVVEHIAGDLDLGIVGRDRVARIRTKGRLSWEEFLRLALLELPFGHSIFEQVYDQATDPGRTHLSKLAWRPPRTISEFEVARDGGLEAIKQYGVGVIEVPGQTRSNFVNLPAGDIRIPVDRLAVFVNDREGGDWYGRSLLRAAYKMWILKDRTLRVQALAAERNGLGLPSYTSAPPPTDANYEQTKEWLEEEIARGLTIAKGARAGEAAGVSLPNGAQFAFVGVTGKVPDLDKQIRYYDEQIGKTVLANFLNLGGDNSTGSYALGDTFENFFTKSLNAVGRHLASVVNQHVIEDLVDANWGTSEPAPRLVPPRIGSDHPATAEAIRALLDSGAISADPALEAHLRAQYRLPARQVDDATGGDRTDEERARYAAETVQKVYLGVGPVIDKDEARDIVRRAGADLKQTTPQQEEA